MDGGSNLTVNVSVADNDTERMQGLMFVEEMPRYNGMLFIFSDEDERSFWMKNTQIPLDIIFIDEHMMVINVEEAEPGGDVPDSELPRYKSNGPCMYVIELNIGVCEEHGIVAGTEVHFHMEQDV